MKIKDIEDPKVQQMAVVETIKERPEYTLENILKIELLQAFTWCKSPQTSNFWYKIYDGVAPKYTDKDLWYKCIKGFAFIDETGVPNGFFINSNNLILATPEEVYNHLKQNDKPMEEPIIYHANLRPTPQQVDQIRLKDENKRLKEEIEDWKKQHVYLSGKVDALKKGREEYLTQNDKLNKLVDEIEEELTKRAGNVFYPQIDLIELIHNYRNPSLVGTTQTVEIDGKKYEVTVNKEILDNFDKLKIQKEDGSL